MEFNIIRKYSVLTESKINQLNNLELEANIRALLNSAIENWNKPNIKIANHEFGIYTNSYKNSRFTINPRDKGCCLIGASVIDKCNSTPLPDLIYNLFGLNIEKQLCIMRIFDYRQNPITKFEKQIASIRDIVFGE